MSCLILLMALMLPSCSQENPNTPKTTSDTAPKGDNKSVYEQPSLPSDLPNNQEVKPKIIKSPPKKDKTKGPARQEPEEAKTTSVETQPKENYVNPSMPKWEESFKADPNWEDLYTNSVTYFLQSVEKNLIANPERSTTKESIIREYKEKMSVTFYKTPEFAEYAKDKFEKSKELHEFLVLHSQQITGD
jgi:hypothetical protein